MGRFKGVTILTWEASTAMGVEGSWRCSGGGAAAGDGSSGVLPPRYPADRIGHGNYLHRCTQHAGCGDFSVRMAGGQCPLKGGGN